jgi:tyrosyl-tRNA synthetase
MEPAEQFGRTMRFPDELLGDWYRLVMESDVDPAKLDPLEAKLELARFIVRRSHGEDGVRRGEDHFTRVVREGQAPEEVEEVRLADPDPIFHLPPFLAYRLGESSSHWRRVIDQGGIKLDGRPVTSYDVPWNELAGAVLQVGKRQFLRLRAA